MIPGLQEVVPLRGRAQAAGMRMPPDGEAPTLSR